MAHTKCLTTTASKFLKIVLPVATLAICIVFGMLFCSKKSVPRDLVGTWVQDVPQWRQAMQDKFGKDTEHIIYRFEMIVSENGRAETHLYVHNKETGEVVDKKSVTKVYTKGKKLFSGEGEKRDWEYFLLEEDELAIVDPLGRRVDRHFRKIEKEN